MARCKHQIRRSRGMTTQYAVQNAYSNKHGLPCKTELAVDECSVCSVMLVGNEVVRLRGIEPIGHAKLSNIRDSDARLIAHMGRS